MIIIYIFQRPKRKPLREYFVDEEEATLESEFISLVKASILLNPLSVSFFMILSLRIFSELPFRNAIKVLV